MLDADEKRLFRRLAVFEGGCTDEAVVAVCRDEGARRQDLLETLEALLDKSLVQQKVGLVGEQRVGMLATLQEYALEQLIAVDEAEALGKQHAAYFQSWVEQMEPELLGRDQFAWYERLEQDRDNVRAALQWLLEREQGEAGLRMAAGLVRFWGLRGYLKDGRHWLEWALTAYRRHLDAGTMSGVPSGADALPPSAIDMPARMRPAWAQALAGVGVFALMQGELAVAQARLVESVAAWRVVGDPRGLGYAVGHLAATVAALGDLVGARGYGDECMAIFRQLNEPWGIAFGLSRLGSLAFYAGEYAMARVLNEERLTIEHALENRQGIGGSLKELGLVALVEGKPMVARTYLQDGLRVYAGMPFVAGIADC